MSRTVQDCRMLTAGMVEWTPAELACFFGMVTLEYQRAPDAVFWSILERFDRDRVMAHSKVLT